MSVACCIPLVECVSCLACVRWVWKKFLYTAGRESENWGLSTATEFEPVPRLCKYILSVYEDNLRNPMWAPPGGYNMNPDWVLLKRDYEDTHGRVAPYMIYLDHDNCDIVLAVRGLSLDKESDFLLLLDNKLGQTTYDGGYVHNGLLKAAQYILQEECETLRGLLGKYPEYMLTFAGHSLGAGVVTLLTMLAVKNREKLGIVERKRIRCFAIAPARCISLNLAVRYADVINSVVLQDDFLPRTTVALENLFKSLFCFPCLLCIMCLKDTCTLEEKMLQDPRRLYAPGRLYHIIVRKPFRCKKISPLVRTAVPVDGRFEHIVLSCNATSDHAIIWILRESERALDCRLCYKKSRPWAFHRHKRWRGKLRSRKNTWRIIKQPYKGRLHWIFLMLTHLLMELSKKWRKAKTRALQQRQEDCILVHMMMMMMVVVVMMMMMMMDYEQ